MANKIRNRKIKPSSRLETSIRYKIDTKRVSSNDMLIVNISHESKPFRATYYFKGSEVAQKDSIHFEVYDDNPQNYIIWSGANPIKVEN